VRAKTKKTAKKCPKLHSGPLSGAILSATDAEFYNYPAAFEATLSAAQDSIAAGLGGGDLPLRL
jgi:hypothetical protein